MTSSFQELNTSAIVLTCIILIVCASLYFYKGFFSKKRDKPLKRTLLDALTQREFYSIGFIWISILIFSFLSIFRTNEKIYRKHIFSSFKNNVHLDDNTILLQALAKEPFYAYAKWVDQKITYFDTLRSFQKINRELGKKLTFPEKIQVYIDANCYNEFDLKDFERNRFDMDTWIPKKSLIYFYEKEFNRANHYYHSKGEKEKAAFLHSLNEGFQELTVELRQVGNKKLKRFE